MPKGRGTETAGVGSPGGGRVAGNSLRKAEVQQTRNGVEKGFQAASVVPGKGSRMATGITGQEGRCGRIYLERREARGEVGIGRC